MRVLRQWQMWLLAGALLALALPAQAAEVDKYLPDDSDVVVVVNVQQIVESPLFKKHASDKIKELLKSEDDVSKTLEALGFDPLKDLTSLTMAFWDIGPDEPKFLVIGHGKFDIAKFEAKAEEVAKEKGENVLKIQKEGDHKVYEVNIPAPGGKALFVGLVDKTTIVAGLEKDLVLDAFAKGAGKNKGKGVKKEVQSMIEKADAKQSLWMAMSSNAWSKAPPPPDETGKKIIDNTESITAGMTIAKDVKFSMTFAAKSADVAKDLEEGLKAGLEKMKMELANAAGFSPIPLAPLLDVVGSIKVSKDGSNVILKSEVSEELIEKGLKKDQ